MGGHASAGRRGLVRVCFHRAYAWTGHTAARLRRAGIADLGDRERRAGQARAPSPHENGVELVPYVTNAQRHRYHFS